MYYFPWIKEPNNEYVFYYDLNNGKHQEKANGYIVIRFADDCIRFYWHNTNFEDPTFPENQQIFSIELFSPKTIGNDILNIQEEQVRKSIKQAQVNIDTNLITDFIREFILELENDEGIFATSSIVNKIRKKLHESIVYRLIAAQQKFHRTCKTGFIDDIEYNKLIAEYSDLLMHPRLTTILPPEYAGKDKLLDNPEYELQQIFDKNPKTQNKQNDTANDTEDKISKLDINIYYVILVYYTLIPDWFNIYWKFSFVVIITFLYFLKMFPIKKPAVNRDIRKKMQNFFFHKHSTVCTYNSARRTIYCIIWISMLIWSILFAYINWNFNDVCCKDYIAWFIITAILIFVCFLVNAFLNWNHNSFFPRISIAIIASWLLIAFSDDFIASQLFIDNFVWIPFTVSIIIYLILYLESREFSPYYCDLKFIHRKIFWKDIIKACNFKITPIFAFALFTSLSIGMIVQYAVFEKLIASSNVLPVVTFSKNFLALEAEKDSLQLLLLDNKLNSMERNEIQHKIVVLNNFRTKYSNTHFLLKVVCTNSSISLCCEDKRIYDKFFPQESLPAKVCMRITHIPGSYLFPRTLVFHSFIVLLISFIVQMIISGKTVTEGLKGKIE
jgi:hypothetical protein